MSNQFGEREAKAAGTLIEAAFREDLAHAGDLTCRALLDPERTATVAVVSRDVGVLAGVPVARLVFSQRQRGICFESRLNDGERLQPGSAIADVSGPLDAILTAERTALNFLTHLSGVATTTRMFVDAVAGTKARILDTRKTLPGLRVLEKYAVRVGGGCNHRMGLYDGILIKDNHLAGLAAGDEGPSIADVVRRARAALSGPSNGLPLQVEVDTLDQLRDALGGGPDSVLLDNASAATLREAVALRDELAPHVQLEASGGVTLETVREIAETGVERISVGALTHSAGYLDIGFDWAMRQRGRGTT
ncbi:MAG: carboxylating nicotinate-nucleotide diphosphorylase [Planctomycetaceae bacterium]